MSGVPNEDINLIVSSDDSLRAAGAAPAQKKWGGKEIKLMARRYT